MQQDARRVHLGARKRRAGNGRGDEGDGGQAGGGVVRPAGPLGPETLADFTAMVSTPSIIKKAPILA